MPHTGATAVHCRDCVHWVEIERLGRDARFLSYSIPSHYCGLALTINGLPEVDRSLAKTYETDMGTAVLVTDADFGCVQGEHRSKPQGDGDSTPLEVA